MVLSPEATEEEVASTVERVDGVISGRGGSVSEHDSWGVRRLAYPINSFADGNYVLTRFELDAGEVSEIDRSLRASEDVMRHLLTKV